MGFALLRHLNSLLVLKLALLVQVALVLAHRPARVVQVAAAAPSGDVSRQTSAKEEIVTLQPGRKGIEMDANTGKLLKVFPDSQAERLGLKPGQRIVQVGAQQYSRAAYRQALETSKPFNITVASPTQLDERVESGLWCMALPSGLLGCLLMLGLPYIFYIRLISTDQDWQLDLCSEVLSRHSILSITLVNALARAGFAMREWYYSDMLAKIRAVADVACVSGLMTGLLLNARNDLLHTPLCSDVVIGFLRKTNWTALILCSTSVLCSGALAWLYRPAGRLDVRHVMKILHALRDVPEFCQLMTLTFLVSRISASARQLMLEVTVAMPCDARDFPKQVHAPCSRVLRDSTPKLSTCGLPLVLVASRILMACFSWYAEVHLLAVNEGYYRGLKSPWLRLLLASCQLGALLLAVVAGPIQLSAALADLENKLNEERHRDGGMHLEVQAVEAMLAKQNKGQGWGIPVFEGFILSKAVLQTMFIRLALAGTVIKAFLDCELGFEKEQEEALRQDLTELKGMLRNMTMLLSATS